MASLILPNQLFPEPLEAGKRYLVEHPKFFTHFDFHLQKLVLHRASMKAYEEEHGADYIEFRDFEERIESIFESSDQVRMYDPVDHGIREDFRRRAEEHGVDMVFHETPGFLASMEWNRDYFEDHEYFQLNYYKEMRKKFDILVKEDGRPVGGKWSFDPENREKMPEDLETPGIPEFSSRHVKEAKKYVGENFPGNNGITHEFFWPVTREQALENLEDFLENRMENFGDYQDAFGPEMEFGFHSLLSPAMNIGLVTPREVVSKTLEAHEERGYPLNSLEGFLRQVTGWREFIRAVYELEPGMRNENFWNASNQMPEEFYTGGTGLPPVDDSIGHAQQNAYCHHIERLMVLGNVMLLLEIDPDEVYRWFMEMFIDSYEWVMVPNIYGMSQYAFPGMMTKPYISSSNYINRMSHYESGKWEGYWDGLYWDFIDRHRDKISEIRRMSFMVSTLERMSEETLNRHREKAREFRERLEI